MLNRVSFILITIVFLISCKNENTEGKKLYKAHCMNCHQEGGKGVGKLIPPISGEFLKLNFNKMPCYIKHGLNGEIKVDGIAYNHEMPKNDRLTDIDIVNILNYIDLEFADGKGHYYTVETIKKSLQSCD